VSCNVSAGTNTLYEAEPITTNVYSHDLFLPTKRRTQGFVKLNIRTHLRTWFSLLKCNRIIFWGANEHSLGWDYRLGPCTNCLPDARFRGAELSGPFPSTKGFYPLYGDFCDVWEKSRRRATDLVSASAADDFRFRLFAFGASAFTLGPGTLRSTFPSTSSSGRGASWLADFGNLDGCVG